MCIIDRNDLLDFLGADNDLAANQPLTLQEIAEANSQLEVSELDEDAEEMEVELIEEELPVTSMNALNAFKVIQRYMNSMTLI
uniref:Uncharacterized protein n=1 Tax=Ditylenchus dipsaci TaxID=166011 RepID=A0A915E986_9BILA